MPFDINRFRSELVSEPASQSKFRVSVIRAPNVLNTSVLKSLEFRCEDAEFPGKVISTTEFKDYGPTRKIAYGSMYNDVSVQMIVTEKMIEKDLFENWHNYIVDDTVDSDIEYYNNYVGEIQIDQFSKDGTIVHSIILEEAYPVTISALPLSWTAKDQYHKLTVEFAYRSYRRK